MSTTTATACIANSDTSKGPEVPLWDCPCRECWGLEQELNRSLNEGAHPDDRIEIETYAEWREARS